MSIVFNKNRRLFRVELSRRETDIYGTSSWGSWIDLTPYFRDILTGLNVELDDTNYNGNITQDNCVILMDNIRGTFNPETATSSLWYSGYHIHHSRIRVYDFFEDEEVGTTYGEQPSTIDPLIDMLIVGHPEYSTIDTTCKLLLASRLDILREHYLFDNEVKKINTITSQSVISYVNTLLNNTYSDLQITTTGGIVRSNVFYSNITPYDRDLLSLYYDVIKQGGAVGGLTNDGTLFCSYFGAPVVSQSNFSTTDASIVYHFDNTDYASGTGTVLYDKTSNGFNGTVTLTSYSDVWKTDGTITNRCRNFFFMNEYDSGGSPAYHMTISDFTIEMIISYDNYNYRQTGVLNWKAISPLLIFSEDDGADLETTETIGGSAGDRDVGLVVDGTGTLFWCYMRSEINTKAYIEIDKLPGDGVVCYIALTFDETAGIYSYYLDGVLRKTFNCSEISVSDLTFRKLLARGAQYYNKLYPMDNTMKLYVHGFRFSQSVKALAGANGIFDTYTRVYGQSFTFGSNSYNYYADRLGQAGDILEVSSGANEVKNSIIYENNSSKKGILQIAFADGVGNFTFSFNFNYKIYDSNDYSYVALTDELGATFTMDDVVALINYEDKDADSSKFNLAKILRNDVGITARIGGAYGTFDKSIIFESNGNNIDFTTLTLEVIDTAHKDFYVDEDKYFVYHTTTYADHYIFNFSNAEVNARIIAEDTDSIWRYGRKTHAIENYELVDTELDRSILTSNALAARKDPKTRVTIRVPYRQNAIKMFDSIVLYVPKQDTRQIPFHFEEGGIFQSWSASTDYRTKSFYVVGIQHAANGTYTQLKLREV